SGRIDNGLRTQRWRLASLSRRSLSVTVRPREMNEKKTWRIQELHGALVTPFVIQIVFMILASMILDGGLCASIVMGAIIGHWLLVLWIALRRRNALTKADTVLIRSGFFFWLPVVFVVRIVLEAVPGGM
ncbi:MAG: hypothetical protein JXR37_21355, partial [Kiritimatiellae bacterium]|nr:hypothetical protein [Kiritimatiellia bacterium]